jgi:hypothetical protein
VIWGKRLILSQLFNIMRKQEGKLFYLLGTCHMLIDMNMMMAFVGILGVDLSNAVLHTSHGFGILETMK